MASSGTRSHEAASTAEQQATPVLVTPPGPGSSHHQLDGKGLTIAIVYSRWFGPDVVDPLVRACANELLEKGVESSNLIRVEVTGAFEIPFAASQLIQRKRDKLDAVVCVGCMVKGATMAFEFVSEAVAMAIMKLNVMTDTPVVFGVLTCASEAQAKACAARTGSCGGTTTATCNHGVEFAQSALELAHLKHATAATTAQACKCKCHCKPSAAMASSSSECSCSCHCNKCACATCSCDACMCTSCDAGGSNSNTNAPTAAASSATAKCTGCSKTDVVCRCVDCNCDACGAKTKTQMKKTKSSP